MSRLQNALQKVTENDITTISILKEKGMSYGNILRLFPELNWDDIDYISTGSRNPSSAKVTSRDVIAITTLRCRGVKYILLNCLYPQIQIKEIERIAKGERWSHIPRQLATKATRRTEPGLRGERAPSVKLTTRKVKHIRKLRSRGYTYSNISNRFDISDTQVANIVKRKNWSHVA